MPTQNSKSATRFTWPNGKSAAVSLTFDDARLSQADVGLPLFARHGVRATFYVSPDPMRLRLDHWKKAVDHGHEIANHTIHHPCSSTREFVRKRGENGGIRYALEDYTLEQMSRELDEASDVIRRELGVTATTFAYPCGETYVGEGQQRQSYVPLVAEKFLIGRSADNAPHVMPATFDPSQVSSTSMDMAGFAALRPLLDAVVRDGGWLTLYGHNIGTLTTHFQTVIVDTLDQLCIYARQHPEIWLDTVANVGKHLLQGV